MEQEVIEALFAGAIAGFFIAFFIAFILILLIGIYIYFALAWMNIARTLKYKKPWLAWVPFANISMILQMGRIHWAWVFLFLIPFFGWILLFVMCILATWRIFEKRKFPGWLSLFQFVPIIYLVVIGFVAWYNQKSQKRK